MKKLICLILAIYTMCMLTGCGGNAQKAEVSYMDVKAEDMINDYIRDTGIAESKYKGKNVQLTGKLIEKGQFNNSSQFYAVISSKYMLGREYSIVVEYPVDKSDELNKLKYGDFVVAKGECVGVVPQKDPKAISVQIKFGKVSDGKNTAAVQPTPSPASTPTPAPAATSSQASTIRTGVITGTEVRMRASGDLSGAILGHFEKGETVTVLEVTEKWTKVQRANGQIGWVSNDFCRM